MSDDVFDGKVLADKLSKLNSSQQCIESSSRLCMSHRKKAKEIVDIWHKSFKSAQLDQHVSFLYLANDILQNSRRKGTEFVNEFWKVMPSALKHVNEHGNENGKKAASRLVGIWDERRVFGSRGQNLKDGMLGKSPLPQTPSNGKTSSNPIKIVKRDANSLRLKLAVGGTPEKIITAFHSVHDENATEDSAINQCEGAVRRVGDLERDIESQGVVPGSSLLEEIQEQETGLQECVNQLETAERTRTSLISQLKEALRDQELKLDVIHTQLQVARNQIDHAANLRKKFVSPSLLGEVKSVEIVPSSQSVSFETTTHVTEEENTKAAAAAVAAKLAASASSAQMLTSVLSSLVAEEAASISNGFNSSAFTSGLSIFPPGKRPKLEMPMPTSDLTNSDAVSSGYFTSNQTSYPQPPLPQSSIGGTSSPANQFVQPSSGLMMGGMPYAYSASSLPPPPPLPLPSHIAMSMMRPTHQPLQQPQQQQQQQSQPQQTGNGGYYRPPGIGFYGQNHQPTPPPVPRQ